VTHPHVSAGFALQLADALLFGRQRHANAWLTVLFRVVLGQPASHGTIDQIQISADLAYAQTLASDHLHTMQLEGGIKGSTGARCRHRVQSVLSRSNPLSSCPLLLNRDTPLPPERILQVDGLL